VKVSLTPGASAYPDTARVCTVPFQLDDVSGIKLPFGAITKNSEIFEIGPIAELGTHPPLGVDVEVSAIMWKITVAFPLFVTETLSEFGLRLAEVSWNFVMYQIAVEILLL
jgi:hypothetical protein